jgi:hypothetical protein
MMDNVLTRILGQNVNRADLFEAVLFAEVTPFTDDQIVKLLPKLIGFIREYRFASNKAELTVVGSAIRKVGMNLPHGLFEDYASLFTRTQSETLPPENELELTKTILLRLADIGPHPAWAGSFSTLEEHLWELFLDYLRPRLILQRLYAPIALYSSLALLILSAERSEVVIRHVAEFELNWFVDLFRRRLIWLRDKRKERGDTASRFNKLLAILQEHCECTNVRKPS